jgi:flagellar hook-associated protein 1 FlgK
LLDAASAVKAIGTLTPGVPINYNGFALSLAGAPALNDRFAIVPTAFPASNNGNALAMDGLASQAFVAGSTVSDAYAQALSYLGSRSSGASAAADASAKVAAASSAALTGLVGVNLDEEAARLMQYQQSYQAAAKVLQTAQTVMDVLMQIGH